MISKNRKLATNYITEIKSAQDKYVAEVIVTKSIDTLQAEPGKALPEATKAEILRSVIRGLSKDIPALTIKSLDNSSYVALVTFMLLALLSSSIS